MTTTARNASMYETSASLIGGGISFRGIRAPPVGERTHFDRYEHAARQIRPKYPFHEQEYRMPGYTGYTKDVAEVFGKTPISLQLDATAPLKTSVLMAPKTSKILTNAEIVNDAANNNKNWLREKPDVLFPKLKPTPAKPGNPPFVSSISFGDMRYASAIKGSTGYTSTYREQCDSLTERKVKYTIEEEFAGDGTVNPKELETEQLKALYAENKTRYTDDMVKSLRDTLRVRIEGKIKPSGISNAFMLRKLFVENGREVDGDIEIHDFKKLVLDGFGLQLRREEAIALFSYYDKECCGVLNVEAFMGDMLDSDYFDLFSPRKMVSNRAAIDHEDQMRALIRKKLSPHAEMLESVFRRLDTEKTGTISEIEVMYGFRWLSIKLTNEEWDFVRKLDRGAGISITAFLARYATSDAEPEGVKESTMKYIKTLGGSMTTRDDFKLPLITGRTLNKSI